jgi:hypothetical protein
MGAITKNWPNVFNLFSHGSAKQSEKILRLLVEDPSLIPEVTERLQQKINALQQGDRKALQTILRQERCVIQEALDQIELAAIQQKFAK